MSSDDRNRSEVALPVLEVKSPDRMARRRAVVLAVVQVLIIVHIVIWVLSREYGWFGGATITPIEPSESMEFGKNGVINAGLIFFVLAAVDTGTGTVVLRLGLPRDPAAGSVPVDAAQGQDQAPTVSIAPAVVGPLIIAVYMFLWPAFYRLVLAPFVQPNLSWPGFSVHLTTRDFWATFPGFTIAVVFLFICGFATVYFGGKGFCTYGCPYGGFFAPLDRFAPAASASTATAIPAASAQPRARPMSECMRKCEHGDGDRPRMHEDDGLRGHLSR